jgi:hypothetical protein
MTARMWLDDNFLQREELLSLAGAPLFRHVLELMDEFADAVRDDYYEEIKMEHEVLAAEDCHVFEEDAA